MGVIADISADIDGALITYAQSIFIVVAGPIRTLLHSMALFGFMFIAVNHIIQFRTVNYSQYLHWGLRFMLIYSFATIWANFSGIYNLLIEVPSDYIILLLSSATLNISGTHIDYIDPSNITDTGSAIDEFGHAIFVIGGKFLSSLNIFHLGRSFRNIFVGIVIIIIGLLFIAAAAVIIMIGKIGFALSMSLAPLAIIMLMLPQTRGYFESWSRFAVGFALIPLLTSGLMAVALFAASRLLPYQPVDDDLRIYVSFIMVMIGALTLLFQIPTMASALSSSSVAAVGAGAALTIARKIKQKGRQISNRGNAQNTTSGGGGATQIGMSSSALNSMRQNSMLRANRRDERLNSGNMGGTKSGG